MALVPATLATLMQTYMGVTSVTPQLLGMATGIVQEILTGIVPTKMPTPGPHAIDSIEGTSMATFVAANAGFPSVSPELIKLCEGISEHIVDNGEVTYSSPVVVGPPPLYGLGGTISGLGYVDMANLCASKLQYSEASEKLIGKCQAIVEHIENAAVVDDGVIS